MPIFTTKHSAEWLCLNVRYIKCELLSHTTIPNEHDSSTHMVFPCIRAGWCVSVTYNGLFCDGLLCYDEPVSSVVIMQCLGRIPASKHSWAPRWAWWAWWAWACHSETNAGPTWAYHLEFRGKPQHNLYGANNWLTVGITSAKTMGVPYEKFCFTNVWWNNGLI